MLVFTLGVATIVYEVYGEDAEQDTTKRRATMQFSYLYYQFPQELNNIPRIG